MSLLTNFCFSALDPFIRDRLRTISQRREVEQWHALLLSRKIRLPGTCAGFTQLCARCLAKISPPAKMQMRLPGVMWGSIAMEAGLARRRRVSLRYSQLAKVRTASVIGCPF